MGEVWRCMDAMVIEAGNGVVTVYFGRYDARRLQFAWSAPVKRYRVSFYQASHSNDAPTEIAADLVASIADGVAPVLTFGRYHYKLNITRMAPGCYKGEVKRYGEDDLPHAGTLDGDYERELELEHHEKTIERNYFLFFQNRKLLVWQENRRACSASLLARYLTQALGETVSFGPVMTPEVTRELLLGSYQPKAIQFAVARPMNPDMFLDAGETDRILRIIAGLDGLSGTFRISANAPGIKGRLLNAARALELGSSLIASGQAHMVRLEMHNLDHPIDLIADRLKGNIDVEMAGRYPAKHSVYSQLQAAKDRVEPILQEMFG